MNGAVNETIGRFAIILHGPPGAGKTTIADFIGKTLGPRCHYVSLDAGWAPNGYRYHGGPNRYRDIRDAQEDVLLIEIGCGEPVDLKSAGATRAAHEWLAILRKSSRKILPFLLAIEWDDAQQRLRERYDGTPNKLDLIWWHTGLHALYEHNDSMATFSPDLNLVEETINVSELSAEEAADFIIRRMSAQC